MGEFDIGKTATSDLTNAIADFAVDQKNTTGATGQDETTFQHTEWSKWYGYYRKIPELKKAIDMKAIWTVGRGFVADTATQVILEQIHGWGNDTFNSILKNMIITMQITGDSFAEIIRDPETTEIINLKPLDPSTIKIVVDKKGIIIRYEQTSKTSPKMAIQKFKPEEIFHLTKDRVADEIHGTSVIESCEVVILMRNEAMDDWKTNLHRNVHPMHRWVLDTDDTGKRDTFKSEVETAYKKKGEHLFIPKDLVEHEIDSIPANATLNPLPWIEYLQNFFYQAVGIPQIILGGSQEFTESTAKIAYLAFQQSVEDDQRTIEQAVWEQLNLEIELEFPASLENELLSDEKKDINNTATINPAGQEER